MEPPELLTLDCKPGTLVYWDTLGGERLCGRLKEWDNGTAIVSMKDGTEKVVRCS